MAASLAHGPRRFASRRRLGVLAWRAGEPFAAPSAPARTRARGPAALAFALAFAAHASVFLAAAPDPRARALRVDAPPFAVRLIHEEPTRAPELARPRRSKPAPALERATAPAPAPAPIAAPAAEPTPSLASEPPPVAAPPPRLHAVFQPAPRYPRAARRRGAEGTTWLRVELTATGRVRSVAVERSAGHADLDRAAADAVRAWRFTAPNGIDASDLWLRIPVDFRLR